MLRRHELRTCRAARPVRRVAPRRWCLLTSGKGGAGTTTVAVNLAVAMARHGDGARCWSTPIRRAATSACCAGSTPHHTLADVLAGGRCWPRSSSRGRAGSQSFPASAARSEAGGGTPAAAMADLRNWSRCGRADVIVIDGGNGLSRLVRHAGRAATWRGGDHARRRRDHEQLCLDEDLWPRRRRDAAAAWSTSPLPPVGRAARKPGWPGPVSDFLAIAATELRERFRADAVGGGGQRGGDCRWCWHRPRRPAATGRCGAWRMRPERQVHERRVREYGVEPSWQWKSKTAN